MNSNSWVCCTYSIYLTILFFFNKYWSFSYTNRNLRIGCWRMSVCIFRAKTKFFHHYIKLSIHITTWSFVYKFTLLFILLLFLHLKTTIFPLLWHTFYVFYNRRFLLQWLLLLLLLLLLLYHLLIDNIIVIVILLL